MKQLYKVLTICSLVIILGTSAIKSVQSSGAPPANYTGAPGSNGTCVSCHSGTLNSGGGAVVTTGLPTVAGGYTLGKTYNFSLTITHGSSNRKRWGFAIKAINASGATVGTFTTTNANAGVSSSELGHRSPPISGTATNTYTYSNLTWKAPATNALADKTIRFYFVGMAADGTGNQIGDFVYSASLNIPQAVSMAVNSFTPTSAGAAAIVIIKGIGFTGATAVSFGGTNAASFTVTNDSTISAVVGSGTSGSVSVTSPSGTGTLAGFTFCPTATTQNSSFTGCNSYTYNGITYTSSTVKKDTIRTTKGCDSIYKNATITIKNLTPTTKNLNFSGCNSYVYNGITYTSSTIKRDTIRTSQGCDSIFKVANITVSIPVTPSNSIMLSANNICYGTKVTFMSMANNGGTSPIYQWFKNGNSVGNSATYEDSLLQNNDSVWCILTSNEACVTTAKAKSNVINMIVNSNISGSIKTPVGKTISNVIVKRKGTIADSSITTSGYSFNCIPSTNTTIIRPSKNNDIKKNNGVSGIDIILVNNHILNKSKLTNAYKIIAADVNNDKSITNIDAIFMKRLVLGIDTTFTGKRLWAFVDSAYKFADTTNPFPYKDSISVTNLADNKINQSFIGIKLGDVNFDWNPSIARGIATKSIELEYKVNNEQVTIDNGQLKIPISVNNFNQLVTMQYTLNFNNNAYEFVGIENNKLGFELNDKQANENGSIGFLWTDAKAEAKSINAENEIFTLLFKKKGFGNLQLAINDDITNIEAWDNDYLQHNVVLKAKQSNQPINQLTNQTFTVFPNPANDVLNIQFTKADVKQIRILNTFGNILYSHNAASTIKSTQVPVKNLASGTYFIEVTTNENKVVKRFIKN